MGAKVKLDKANVAKGVNVEVQGLGNFPNGQTSDVKDATWARFRAKNPDYPENYTFEIATEPAPEGETEGTGTAAPLGLDLESMNKDQLKEEAERRGIDTTDKKASDLRQELS